MEGTAIEGAPTAAPDDLRHELYAELLAEIAALPELSPEGVEILSLWGAADRFLRSFTERVAEVAGEADHRDAATLLALHERVVRGVEASLATAVGAIDERGIHFCDGHRRVSGFLKASVRMSKGEATARVRTAELLRQAPQLGEQLAAGEIGVAQVRELARLLANPRIPDETVIDAIPQFVEHAKEAEYESFRTLTREWEELVDQDGAHRDAEAAHENRDVKLSPVWNSFRLDGRFGAVQGAQIAEVFDRFVAAEFATDWDEAKAVFGDDTCVGSLRRTEAQRRADALFAMAMAAAGAPVDVKGGVEPVVNILVDQATFETAAESVGATAPSPSSTGRRMCRTVDGVPVDPHDAVTAAVVGQVRRVVLGSDGVIINMGRRQRLFKGNSRVAAMLQVGLDNQGRCTWPGCWRRRIQLDHAAEWAGADRGRTDVDNANGGCGHHNRWKHHGGYTVRRDKLGHWHTYRSDGSEIRPY